MGYRGKLEEQAAARALREQGWTVPDIAEELGVAKSSVSLWVRDIEITIVRRKTNGWRNGSKKLKQRRLDEIEQLKEEGRQRIGQLTDREFFLAGVMLYAGEGSKTDGSVALPNSDPRMLLFFITWLRKFFEIDESRLRLKLYLHEGLDIDSANAFWSDLTGIPQSQFGKPYRAKADPSIRKSKHPMGCPSVVYSCSTTHRTVMGLVHALLACPSLPG